MSMLDRILRGKIKQGSLTVLSQSGEASHYGERQSGWPDVTMRIQSSSAISRILLNPRLGMGEAYMNGDVSVDNDDIMGFITKGSGISVHRDDCRNAQDLVEHQGERVVGVSWLAGAASIFLVNIQIEALDRARLLADVTRTLSEQHVNILSAAVSTSKDRVAISKFTFEMADAKHLDSVLAAVRSVEGVYDVYRT